VRNTMLSSSSSSVCVCIFSAWRQAIKQTSLDPAACNRSLWCLVSSRDVAALCRMLLLAGEDHGREHIQCVAGAAAITRRLCEWLVRQHECMRVTRSARQSN
jgi:hypothetical protein